MEPYKQLFLLTCDHAFIDQHGKISIIGVFENINFAGVPSQLVKMVVVGSYLVSDLKVKEVKLEINILKPDNLQLFHLQNDHAKINDDRRLNVLIELVNIKFDLFGEYKIETIINGIKSGEQNINVKKLSN